MDDDAARKFGEEMEQLLVVVPGPRPVIAAGPGPGLGLGTPASPSRVLRSARRILYASPGIRERLLDMVAPNRNRAAVNASSARTALDPLLATSWPSASGVSALLSPSTTA